MTGIIAKNDFVLMWVPDGDGKHNKKPVMLTDYIRVVESVLTQPQRDEILKKLGTPLDWCEDSRPDPVPALTPAASPSLPLFEFQSDFKTHTWTGREASDHSVCTTCGHSSNSLMATKKCGYKA